MRLLKELIERFLEFFTPLNENDWVEWIAQKNDFLDNCDKLDRCYFIVKHMPAFPQHVNCRCRLEKIAKPIPNVTAKPYADIRKFTEYVFREKGNRGKKELFENWGYTVEDSEYLKELFLSQAIEKYCNGEYEYKGMGGYYPRIETVIELKTKNQKELQIKTGWSLLPKGEIKMSTPFSGFKE